jgi:hypothetical protein
LPAIRGLTVAVGEWYARTLEVCLVRNMRHLVECWVVTAPGDPCAAVARAVPGVHVVETDAFTRHGARFNKGLGMEEGLEAMGRRGWILIHDADILFPDSLGLPVLSTEKLYGAHRRLLKDVDQWRPDLDWNTCHPLRDGGPIGFWQLFHADAPSLAGRRPWYEVSFAHAGGCDDYFMRLFPADRRVVLPVQVLHLGPCDTNWFGADPEGRDMMARYVTENGWLRAMQQHAPEAAQRAAPPPRRVEVPGYEPTGYELPFERRARAMQWRPPR